MQLHEITVRSMRGGNFSFGLNDIRVDRGSVLGNPYDLSKDESNRHEICEADKHWFYANILTWLDRKKRHIPSSQWGSIDPLNFPTKKPERFASLRIADRWKAPTVAEVEREFTRICGLAVERDISLVCWCFPKECHADTRRLAIIWYVENHYKEECSKIETTIREFFN